MALNAETITEKLIGPSKTFSAGRGGVLAQAAAELGVIITKQLHEQAQREFENNQRGSIVAAYCDKLFHELVNCSDIRACVVTVANLPTEFSNLVYIGNETLGNVDYSVSVGYQGGWIKNNGNRGFENWCVCGYNHQEDNIIYID